MSETKNTTSSVTNNLIDLFVVRSSTRPLPLALTHQLPAHNSSGISILDLDCGYSGYPVPSDLERANITASSNSAPPGDLLLMDSDDCAMDSTCGGGCNRSFLCFIESPPSHNLALSGTLATAIPPHLRDGFEYPPIRKQVERGRSVLKVVIPAPKEAKEERKATRSLISGPIISANITWCAEVGNTAWARGIEQNAEKDSVELHLLPPAHPDRTHALRNPALGFQLSSNAVGGGQSKGLQADNCWLE
ncbi:hypothetical protein L873DRAFT_1272419 [Choiromyces venosus 120613-1]|uniref:Uncharacterized protein n=1 Tax=Choiromyces venosus 120613-1 TaxID=1336337 RepID=A0A3N4K5E0_9PEZI|nr:hypothetical protein L873DRAFT_1272419 [Choiromyces venosus 120613-1]